MILNNADDEYMVKYVPLIVPSIIFFISLFGNYALGNLKRKRRKKWVFGISFILLVVFGYYEIFVMQFVERFFSN